MLWIVWASACVAQGVANNLELVRDHKDVQTGKKIPAYDAFTGNGSPFDSTYETVSVPVGGPHMRVKAGGSVGGVVPWLLLGLVSPALPFIAMRWIARGFSGSGQP